MRPFLPLLLLALPALAQESYHRAPKAIQEVLDAPLPPQLSVNPTGDMALLVELERHPGIRDLAAPMLRLAGERVNPRAHAPHLAPRLLRLTLKPLRAGGERPIALPPDSRFGPPAWSPDGRRFALTGIRERRVELWIGDARTGRLRRIPRIALNTAFGEALDWMGSGTLLVKAVPSDLGPEPAAPEAPLGPRVQEHDPAKGKAAPVRTYQDLLQNAQDELLFEHHARVQLMKVDVASGRATALGRPGLYASVQPAPDGRHVLVATVHRPFSYLQPRALFPHRHEVWDARGKLLHTLADLPLADDIPIEGVRKGPRQIHWIPTEPATLSWVEALDEGDPKRKVEHRDRLLALPAPFDAAPRELARIQHRLQSVQWGERGDLALLREYERERKWARTWRLDPRDRDGKPQLLWDLSAQDRYKQPGAPLTRVLPHGHAALREEGGKLWLHGEGATPKGDRPFLDAYDLASHQTTRLFQSSEGGYENPVALLPGGAFLTRKEAADLAPHYVLHRADGAATALTEPRDPAPILRRIQKRLVRYQRPDGVELSFTLYLPPDYRAGERRPAFLWAYPLEYASASDAGQVLGSSDRFTQMGGASHLFLLLAGYVVLDNATMPVVGTPETVNNTFLDQITASARAALDKANELGVIDPARVAVGGHSYGAFMTANLLAHCDLFKAGIARSGAYNRTLTPFGFQSERRTLWEAPDMYLKVSPFLHADRFKAPLLLLHGEADNNPGTFPIQSERLFQALKGNNQAVRYVTLPLEAHGYAARESLEHTLWEMTAWLDRHLKHLK